MTAAGPGPKLAARLRVRLPEIEEACFCQIYAIADPSAIADPAYREGLRLAASAALEYEIAEACAPAATLEIPVPLALLTQARAAAHAGVSLDTVLRRCCAGDAVLRSCLIEEAGKAGLSSSDLRHALHAQAASFDRLLDVVGAEHHQALEARLDPARRHTEHVERLLADESVETAEIPYDFDAHHIGVIAAGPVEVQAIRSLAHALDRRLLAVSAEPEVLWAWLGGRYRLDTQDLRRVASAREWLPGVLLAIGEPGFGPAGWRQTHQQAQAALTIAKRSSKSISRYADVAMLSALARDDLLVRSLNQMYLAPLEKERDRGKALRETLRAYFLSERSVSSAAAVLGVKRHTVTNRLRTVEDRIGQPLSTCAAALDAALSLEELTSEPSAQLTPR